MAGQSRETLELCQTRQREHKVRLNGSNETLDSEYSSPCPLHASNEPNRSIFVATRNTHTRCSRASRTRSKLHGKATANRDTARIVELPFSRTSSDGFLTVSPFFLSFFFLLPPEIPTLDPFFILYFSHRLRCGAPLLLFLNQCEQHYSYFRLLLGTREKARNQRINAGTKASLPVRADTTRRQQ